MHYGLAPLGVHHVEGATPWRAFRIASLLMVEYGARFGDMFDGTACWKDTMLHAFDFESFECWGKAHKYWSTSQ